MAHPEYPADIRGDGRAVLKHDRQLNIMAAHCRHALHGDECRVNRTLNHRANRPASGRPAGFLLAWLAMADDFPDQKSHHAASLMRSAQVDERLNWQARQACRDWLNVEAPAETREFVADVEADLGEEQDREPLGLC